MILKAIMTTQSSKMLYLTLGNEQKLFNIQNALQSLFRYGFVMQMFEN